jgi:hypothetical protein
MLLFIGSQGSADSLKLRALSRCYLFPILRHISAKINIFEVCWLPPAVLSLSVSLFDYAI